jgi:hypothetical protein
MLSVLNLVCFRSQVYSLAFALPLGLASYPWPAHCLKLCNLAAEQSQPFEGTPEAHLSHRLTSASAIGIHQTSVNVVVTEQPRDLSLGLERFPVGYTRVVCLPLNGRTCGGRG